MNRKTIQFSTNQLSIHVEPTPLAREINSQSLPIVEDLARREKTPFVMTSLGRSNKTMLGWEVGPAMQFSPGDPS